MYYYYTTYSPSYYLLLRSISVHAARHIFFCLIIVRILYYIIIMSPHVRVCVCLTVFHYLIVIIECVRMRSSSCSRDVTQKTGHAQLYVLLFFINLVGRDCMIFKTVRGSSDDRNEINWTRRTGCVRERKRGKRLMVDFIKYIVVVYNNNNNNDMTAYLFTYVCV